MKTLIASFVFCLAVTASGSQELIGYSAEQILEMRQTPFHVNKPDANGANLSLTCKDSRGREIRSNDADVNNCYSGIAQGKKGTTSTNYQRSNSYAISVQN